MISLDSKIISLFLLCAAASGCKPRSFNSDTLASPAYSGKPVVIAQCSIPQGNGGNWAATLGWVSEQMMVRAEHADRLSKDGRAVGIYLGCMAGGSSGSVVTNVVMRILNNKSLVTDANSEKLFSASETRTLARAVRYVALAADLNLRELAVFFAQVAGNNAASFLNKSKIVEQIRSLFGQQDPKWWNGQQVDGNMMLVDFAALLHLSENLTARMVNEPAERFLNGDLLKIASAHKISRVTDFAIFDNLQEMQSSSVPSESLDKILDRQSEHIGKTADEFTAKHFALGQYKARYLTNVFRDGKKDYPLTVTLERPLSRGFCTVTMAAFAYTSSSLSLERAPDYKNLRPVLFCSADMIRTLLKSELYRRHLKEGHPFASRFVLASVKTSRGSISPSIREPAMMSELIGEADKGVLEVDEFYAPDIDKKISGDLSFQPVSIAALAKANGGLRPVLGVAGGFPDRRITAWMMSYFFADKIEEFRRRGFEVTGRIGMFGKPDNRAVDKFDTSSIRTVFSADPQAAQANVQDWFSFQDSYCDTFEPLFAASAGKITTVAFNWDLTKIPAAQSGASRLVLVKGANAARSQLGLYESAGFSGFVFDPNSGSEHVPQLTRGYPCKP